MSTLPAKTYMRRSLTMHNPNVIKSSDGRVYKKNGQVKDLTYVRPKGRVYVAPPNTTATGGSYEVLKPFQKVFKRALDKKGLKTPENIDDTAKLFYNQVIAAKGFNGNKPVNFEAMDHADSAQDQNIVSEILTYMRSLVAGVQPNGTPLATQDAQLAPLAKDTVNDIAGKVANAGLSPADAAAAGAHLSNAGPSLPFYKDPMWRTIGIVVVAFIFIYMLVK